MNDLWIFSITCASRRRILSRRSRFSCSRALLSPPKLFSGRSKLLLRDTACLAIVRSRLRFSVSSCRTCIREKKTYVLAWKNFPLDLSANVYFFDCRNKYIVDFAYVAYSVVIAVDFNIQQDLGEEQV